MKNLFFATLIAGGIFTMTAGAEASAAQSCGKASWYALTSTTASGEKMNPAKLTAAHRKYRFGTKLRVTNRKNGRSVIVRINDRGPFAKGRVLDLSKAAASKLGMIRSGHASVCFEAIS